ncbi:MAG: long-chain fatty acid--CoA ligase [Planctomycetes bacterium]|nr:long-chain fatty acid--CoA ligase [Planctomycetota bacterium]
MDTRAGRLPRRSLLLRMPNRAEFVIAYYAALYAGAVVVASSPAIGEGEYEAQKADAEPVLVMEGGPGRRGRRPPAPPDIATLQYTSGTTGRSKGAIMSHVNLVANALQNAHWFGWDASVVNLAVLPLCHTWGMCVCLNSTFAVWGTLVLAERFDEEETFALIERRGVTVLYGSATMFHRLLDGPARPIGHLRHVKAGAMLTQGDLKRRWDERYPQAPLQQGYGLTEASPECHNNPPHRFKAGTVGIPIQGTDCRIVEGEVQLRGAADHPGLLAPPRGERRRLRRRLAAHGRRREHGRGGLPHHP